MRLLPRALAALQTVCAVLWFATGLAGAAHAATPALYVYTGSLTLTHRFENMLGCNLDGQTQFDAFDSPASALGALNYGLPGLCGLGYGVSIRFPAAFSNTTLQQVAAGAADAQCKAMFTAMQACVAPAKYVSIGHEMNAGTNYPWAGRGGSAFIAAYQHIFAIGRANCPSCKLTFNPGIGQDPSSYNPGDAYVDELDWDFYPNAYASGGKYDEADLVAGNIAGYWALESAGPATPGRGWKASLPVGFPEMGVGGESNGMGVCPATNPSGCDDGPMTATVLAYMIKTGATRLSWWEFDGGGYNALLGDGLRPAEAIEVLKVFGGQNMPTLLARASAYTGTAYKASPPTGYVAILAELATATSSSSPGAPPSARPFRRRI